MGVLGDISHMSPKGQQWVVLNFFLVFCTIFFSNLTEMWACAESLPCVRYNK